MTVDTRILTSESEEPLHLRIWRPETSAKPTGAVILAHGLGEHAGRYDHVARHFTKRGFMVYGPDMIGFGQSGGRRGHLPGGIQSYKRELIKVAELARTEVGLEARMIWLGHSMGGLAVLLTMFDEPGIVQEAIVAGPALDSGRDLSLFRKSTIRLLAFLLPSLTTDHGIPSELICSDPAVVQAYRGDPLVHRRISMELAASVLSGGTRIRRAAPSFKPSALLLLQGAQDTIAYPEVTQAFAQQVSCEPKEYVELSGMRHEVFNERERERTFDAVDQFFNL